MEPLELKAEFGKQLAFMGGVDTQGILPTGTVAEVRKATARLVEGMTRDGGGFILAASHTIPPETPDDNIFAMYAEAGISREEIFDRAAQIRIRLAKIRETWRQRRAATNIRSLLIKVILRERPSMSTLSRRNFLGRASLGLAGAALFPSLGKGSAPVFQGLEKRPNILFILADDQGWADAHFAGIPMCRRQTWTVSPARQRGSSSSTWRQPSARRVAARS